MGEEAVLADSERAGEKADLSEQPAVASERICEDPSLTFLSCSISLSTPCEPNHRQNASAAR